jgi:hypothetical protein
LQKIDKRAGSIDRNRQFLQSWRSRCIPDASGAAEIVFWPVFWPVSGVEFLDQGSGRVKTVRGAMTRIFEVDGIARNGAAQQARFRSVPAWKIGAISLFFEQNPLFQVFGSPKPGAFAKNLTRHCIF